MSDDATVDKNEGDNLESTPLERSYKCQVLGHYPESVLWNPFDRNAVGMLCLPHGLQFRTQKHSLEPQFHSFVITREDGRRSYGFSHVFYEEVRNRKICSAMQTLQAMHLTELSSSQVGSRSRRNHSSGLGHDAHNTRSLPRHFKLSTHKQGAAQSYYDAVKDTLYVCKSIALICQLPYVYAARKFLAGLHRLVSAPCPGQLSIESYVHNMLYEVPTPQPGRSVHFTCPVVDSVIIQRPGSIEELPLFDFPLRELFTLLGVECFIQLFTCVLLEHQVLLCSSDYHRLMLVAESVTALLFPFSWQHVYVPILPASLQHFLDAPVPFIMGLHSCSESQLKSASEANLCYVDIDSQTVQLPEELPSFPQRAEFVSELVELLAKHKVSNGQADRNLSDCILLPHGSSNVTNLMTSSCTLPGGFGPRMHRKHSWSHNTDSGVPSGSNAVSPQSDALQRIVAIVQCTGVSLDGCGQVNGVECELPEHEQYIEDLRFNNAVREVYLNRFVYMFSAYEHFVIQPNQDKEQWLKNRDSMQNFDKATFLSDQPEHHLPFLSRFIESQMFATLIDNKIMANWSEVEPNLRVFDRRIRLLRKRFGEALVRTPGYETCTTIRDTELLLEKRLVSVDAEVVSPQEIRQASDPLQHSAPPSKTRPGIFPLLDPVILNKEPVHRSRKCNTMQWRTPHRYPHHRSSERREAADAQSASDNAARTGSTETSNGVGLRQPKLSGGMSPALVAQTNWSFVEKLLKDCKSKTKRMLVEKMGTEAVELGHGSGEGSLVGVEENTLIASLCDLLERIWSHGLQNKQGKSALWSHLTNYQELKVCDDTSKPIDPNFLTPALAWCVLRKRLDYLSSMALETDFSTSSQQHGRETHKLPTDSRPQCSNTAPFTPSNSDQPNLHPLPVSLTTDMRNVQAMTDIKTHIGYARAWVRLSLEKKLLSRHLHTLLSDSALLRSQYKRYAFLRCEDEKEQFLYHLLTLNAVEYFCFTNTYTGTILPYRVVIFPSRKTSAATTSANSWVTISGTLGETSPVPIPRGALEFVFRHKNLGILTTLRIGHDNCGPSPKWMVEHVVVRNEVTGHMYKFPCGRWLGRGIDDDSTERLLVGELVPCSVDSEELVETCRTPPPRCHSPSVPRRSQDARPSVAEIQHMLGDAVNSIVKLLYHRKHEKERSMLTLLLCGETGLVYCLEQAFLTGFKSTRLFGRNLYLWDYFLRAKEHFEAALLETDPDMTRNSLEEQVLYCYCHLVDQIESSRRTLGKDGKFQLLVCLCAREHLLSRMLRPLSACRVTLEMYEEQSFIRNPALLTFLQQILESLDEFDIVLENSLTQGIGGTH
ncbi:DENN domain-containing protein 5A isoform X4 [Zootermopsis nevadensis]|uniref:DENN domain-containing protein 5A isoform X4 n=1 Tax=Zootermopsis nevadensis TaxID=136037 RepID=UPI000B8EA404|nr:DENN domain-containing protein 5A isoform X4 [Zootermopsis nevadensis]